MPNYSWGYLKDIGSLYFQTERLYLQLCKYLRGTSPWSTYQEDKAKLLPIASIPLEQFLQDQLSNKLSTLNTQSKKLAYLYTEFNQLAQSTNEKGQNTIFCIWFIDFLSA